MDSICMGKDKKVKRTPGKWVFISRQTQRNGNDQHTFSGQQDAHLCEGKDSILVYIMGTYDPRIILILCSCTIITDDRDK